MEQAIRQLEEDLIQLKTTNTTVGDSATAYRQILDFSESPSASNKYFIYDITVEPIANRDQAIVVFSGDAGWTLDDESLYADSAWNLATDMNNPFRVAFRIDYLGDTGYSRHIGGWYLIIDSNVPVVIKNQKRTEYTR